MEPKKLRANVKFLKKFLNHLYTWGKFNFQIFDRNFDFFQKISVIEWSWEKRKNSYIENGASEKYFVYKIMNKRRLFYNKSGVRFSIWPFLNFWYLVIEISKEFCGKGRRCKILIFSFFQPLLMWSSLMPHNLYTVHWIQSQFYIHLTVIWLYN